MIGDLGFCLAEKIDADQRGSLIAGTARSILDVIERAYPCAEQQTLTCAADLELPRDRFAVFFGSFDWHSCVHSHWSLVRLLASGSLAGHPELEEAALSQLECSFDPARVSLEVAAWTSRIPEHFERPYGHTWFLELDAELMRAEALGSGSSAVAAEAAAWRAALAPLTAEMLRRVRDWADGVVLPIRSGIHSDTAWSLSLAWDWAAQTGDAELAESVRTAAQRLYASDVNAPVAYEPEGQTFSSSILNEAALMARVYGASDYERWLQGFLPQLFDDGFGGGLIPDPVQKWDGKNYYGVHEVALPLSRGIAARDAAAALPEGSPAQEAFASEARRWTHQGLADLTLAGYLADHWVGSFVVASLVGSGSAR